MTRLRIKGSLRDRLYAQLVPDPETGCLLWTGHVNANGYARIGIGGGRTSQIHRVAWELEYGPIPAGLEIDHVRERGCVHRHSANPAHLEPVPHRVNTLRGRGFAAVNAAKVSCPAGHEYDLLNTIFYQGRRYCRACNRVHGREKMRRRRRLAKQLAADQARAVAEAAS